MSQREGRIIRQGNENPEVEICTYVTENTFDSCLYQLVENKLKYIGQIMTSKSPVKSAEDIDEQALSYAYKKAAGSAILAACRISDLIVSRLNMPVFFNPSKNYSPLPRTGAGTRLYHSPNPHSPR